MNAPGAALLLAVGVLSWAADARAQTGPPAATGATAGPAVATTSVASVLAPGIAAAN